MPQPLQPLPQLQELPHPHFPEQQDIFGSSLRLDDRRWRWRALIGFLVACWLEEQWQRSHGYL
jgi:hypothetical protein